ncbi:MAG: thioredoxin [Ignavibacteriae bacterium]|nr:MAG: thioredoxin [Ignavibacteriota bacterium]
MKPVELSEGNFEQEVLKSSTPVLVDFWAVWCGPCKMIAPIVDELATEYEGKLKIGKVDVDNHQQIAMQYGIRSIPTLLIFKDGKVVEQLIGAAPKKTLVEKLLKHLN